MGREQGKEPWGWTAEWVFHEWLDWTRVQRHQRVCLGVFRLGSIWPSHSLLSLSLCLPSVLILSSVVVPSVMPSSLPAPLSSVMARSLSKQHPLRPRPPAPIPSPRAPSPGALPTTPPPSHPHPFPLSPTPDCDPTGLPPTDSSPYTFANKTLLPHSLLSP